MSLFIGLKWLHVISSTVLLGTGAGIAFFLMRAQRSGDVRVIAAVSREVVLADAIFTATAVIVQPVTGFAMAAIAGYPLSPVLALGVARALWVDWRVLAAGVVAAAAHAGSGAAGSGAGHRPASGIPALLPVVAGSWLARFQRPCWCSSI